MIWIVLYTIGFFISLPVLAAAWAKIAVRHSYGGFGGYGDILFVVGETLLTSFMWPLTLPFAILYLLDKPRLSDHKMKQLEDFVNDMFGKQER